ncbi:MAG: endonuclease domain-containing protein [Acidimicrobiia bacterium]|nr:endonuclease domain-containing protein [Acidimicrobiia bacterium]
MHRPRHTTRAQAYAKDLRASMTPAEKALWVAIRRQQTGAKFRRQVPIGPWIVDFASFEPKIVVEVDDTSHDWKDEADRTEFLESRGFTVLRFTNRQAAFERDGVVAVIETTVATLRIPASGGPGVPWLGRG